MGTLKVNRTCCILIQTENYRMKASSCIVAGLVLVVCLLPHVKVTAAKSQELDCYDNTPDHSVKLTFKENYQKLNNFQNIISYCSVTGIWILYENDFYNDAKNGGVYWNKGDNLLFKMPDYMDNKASSLRYVGDQNDWKIDTLNLYLKDHFTGVVMYMHYGRDGNIQQVENNQIWSIIVTGCKAWTLYEYANFQGSCKCVEPGSYDQCEPRFYQTQDLGYMAGRVRSARYDGCFCNNFLKTEEQPEGKSA